MFKLLGTVDEIPVSKSSSGRYEAAENEGSFGFMINQPEDYAPVFAWTLRKGFSIGDHRHLSSESLFMISGRLQIVSDGLETVLEPGDMHTFPPGQTHSCEALEDCSYIVAFQIQMRVKVENV